MTRWLHCKVTLNLFSWWMRHQASLFFFKARFLSSCLFLGMSLENTHAGKHTLWVYLQPVFDLTLPLCSQQLRSKQHPNSPQAAAKWLWWKQGSWMGDRQSAPPVITSLSVRRSELCVMWSCVCVRSIPAKAACVCLCFWFRHHKDITQYYIPHPVYD